MSGRPEVDWVLETSIQGKDKKIDQCIVLSRDKLNIFSHNCQLADTLQISNMLLMKEIPNKHLLDV